MKKRMDSLWGLLIAHGLLRATFYAQDARLWSCASSFVKEQIIDLILIGDAHALVDSRQRGALGGSLGAADLTLIAPGLGLGLFLD